MFVELLMCNKLRGPQPWVKCECHRSHGSKELAVLVKTLGVNCIQTSLFVSLLMAYKIIRATVEKSWAIKTPQHKLLSHLSLSHALQKTRHKKIQNMSWYIKPSWITRPVWWLSRFPQRLDTHHSLSLAFVLFYNRCSIVCCSLLNTMTNI